MLSRLLLSSLFVPAVLLSACKKDEAAPAPAPVPALTEAPPAPAAPAAPVYSPEAATRLLAELEKCDFATSCDALAPLVGFGTPVVGELVKLALDTSKDKKPRRVAATALQRIKPAGQGVALVEAAQKEEDFMVRGDLFQAAGASGDARVLELAGAHILTEKGWDMRQEEIQAISPFGKPAFDWAIATLGGNKVKDARRTTLADVIELTATTAELPALAAAIAAEKHQMTAQRLAAKAVDLGDPTAFVVIIAGLESKDEYERSDAAGQLAPLASKLPAALKDRTVELLKSGKARDQGGLTARSYDDALKALGAS